MTSPSHSASHAPSPSPPGSHSLSPPRSAPLDAALLGAAELINAVLGGRTLDAALATSKISGTTRAAAMDLAYCALRDFGRGDFLLAQLMTSPLKDAAVRGLLLAAMARLEARPDEAHTTVDQAVNAAAHLAGGRFKGLANGVLRSFLRRSEELLAAADVDDHARWRHPEWWIARLRQSHPQHWMAILAAGNTRPPMTLRLNRRRITSADFLGKLAAEGILAHALTDVAIRLERPVPVERLPGFADGLCSVQDAGAQRAALYLDVSNGQRVLDACAAPGGKTAHLLEVADLDLLALDADATRAARISENLNRLGLASDRVQVQAEDCRDVAKWWDGRPFDRILADVPCTASGVVRRHPDAKWLRRAGDVAQFARTQTAILDALWQTLAPGGKMLYVTCSVFADENTRQVDAFVGRHADARRQSLTAAAGGDDGTALELYLLPDSDHDGFFYALLQKV